MHKLTLFYDGACPLCLAEMAQLRRLDRWGHLKLVDIAPEAFDINDFKRQYPDIDRDQAFEVLHGLRQDGSVLKGLDVTVAAWKLVGQKRWLAILRWPLIAALADWAYLRFARHRYVISYLLTGKKYSRCEPSGECRVPPKSMD